MTVAEVTTFSPERAALRARHVGASEVAAIFNMHPHLSLFELWMRKAGRLPEEDLSDNDRVFWGTVLEPAIGFGLAARVGWKIRKVRRYCQHPTVAGMGASPDFEATGHPTRKGRGTVQVKNVDGLVFREWENGQPPMVYMLQVQHEIACGGYEWGCLAALVGGNRLEIFEYDRHEATIAKLEEGVTEFWRTVHTGEEPVPDFARDLETIRSLYSVAAEGKVADLSADQGFSDACARYLTASEDEKAAATRKEAAKAEILSLTKDAEVAISDAFRVSAKNIPESKVSFTRAAHRTFRCSETRTTKEQKGTKK